MAARRLIAILIVLMLVSTFAAALAPQRRDRTETTETTSTTTPTTTAAPDQGSGELIEATIPARASKPQLIEVKPGDQLSLVVRVANPQPVTVSAFGLTDFAAPGDPARFDILVRKTGTVAIEVGERGGRKTVGRIQAG